MIEELRQELEALKGTFRERTLSGSLGHHNGLVEYRGKTLIDFTNWDLLGLSNRPKVKRAFQSSAELHGIGSAASRIGTGTTPEHLSAELRIAKFLGTEDALIFSSRNQAVFSLLTNLLNERDILLVDEQFSGPAQDAAFMAQSSCEAVDVGDAVALGTLLEKERTRRRRMVIAEHTALSSGRQIDVAATVALCARHNAELVVDQTAALGTYGLLGSPAEAVSLVTVPPLAQVGDLCGLGLCGGFIAGPQLLINFLVQRSRAFASESPLPRPLMAALEESLSAIELAHGARQQLALKVADFRGQLSQIRGIPKVVDSNSALVSLLFSKPSAAHTFVEALFQRNILAEVVQGARHLSEESYCRFLVRTDHTERQIKESLAVIAEVCGRIEST